MFHVGEVHGRVTPRARGFAVEPVFGLPATTWVAAGRGEGEPLEAVRATLASVARPARAPT